MGLFDFLSSSPEKKIDKAKQVMLNEHHQHQVRQQAIYDLGQFDNELAVQAADPTPWKIFAPPISLPLTCRQFLRQSILLQSSRQRCKPSWRW